MNSNARVVTPKETATGVRGTFGPCDMSLLKVCTSCLGKCCVGRTMAADEERKQILAFSGKDHFIHWKDDLYYLDGGLCPYLTNGLCSAQEVKPFVCQIFPLVPRVVGQEFWLYCVGECDAAVKLPEGFIERAIALARIFFSGRTPDQYAEYWDLNKQGDFNEARVVFKVKVYREE